MMFQGRIHRFGDHIDTDQIIPARFLGLTDPEALSEGCFLNLAPGFSERVAAGDILVAGDNFGCGSSREHAPIAIKGAGIGCVVARSFSRIFYRSAINIGLPAVICPEVVDHAKEGEVMTVDFESGTVTVAGKAVPFAPFSPEIVAIIEAGGLVAFMAHRLQMEKAPA